MNKKEYTEALEQLKNLHIAIYEKDETLKFLIKQERQLSEKLKKVNPRSTGAYDCDGTQIYFGDVVEFQTKGKYKSSRGIVYKVSSNKLRVTARDEKNFSISRAPKNLKIVTKSHEHDCCSGDKHANSGKYSKRIE